MKRIIPLAIALIALAMLTSCSKKSDETAAPSSEAGTSTPAASATTSGAAPESAGATASAAEWTMPSDLDEGPRAAGEPVDAALASQGAGLFKSKGCVTCHAFGKKVIGPDLMGVPAQRTSRWMESQILHPDKMIVHDPTSKALFAQYKVPMTNQGLTPDQAKAVVEYIKQTNKAGGAK